MDSSDQSYRARIGCRMGTIHFIGGLAIAALAQEFTLQRSLELLGDSVFLGLAVALAIRFFSYYGGLAVAHPRTPLWLNLSVGFAGAALTCLTLPAGNRDLFGPEPAALGAFANAEFGFMVFWAGLAWLRQQVRWRQADA